MNTYTAVIAFATVGILSLLPACGGHVGAPCLLSDEQYACNTSTIVDTNAFGDVVSCSVTPLPNRAPCKTGVGVCEDGGCIEPPTVPASCQSNDPGKPPASAQSGCFADADCAIDNPCVEARCPHGGADGCLFAPLPDGVACGGDGRSCMAGSCCDCGMGVCK